MHACPRYCSRTTPGRRRASTKASEHRKSRCVLLDGQVISTEIERIEHFVEHEMFVVSEDDYVVRGALHFAFDEAKKMLLVH